MPQIPVRIAQEPIRVGGINVQATAQEFGADVGAATEGLGQAIAGLGSAFTGVGERLAAKSKSDAADADKLAVANALAQPENNFDTIYNDTTTGYDPATADQPLPTTVGGKYNAWVDERVNLFQGTAKAKEAFRLRLLAEAPAYIHGAAVTSANNATASSVNASEVGLNTIINNIRANGANDINAPAYDPTTGKVRPSTSRYDIGLQKGLDLLDNQPGFDAAAKEKAKIAFRSNAAAANFEALATAAKTPEEIAALRTALGSDQWTSQFTDTAHAAAMSMLDTRENQIGAQGKAQFTADLNEFIEVANAKEIPTPELAQRVRLGISAATPDEYRRFMDAQITVETTAALRGMPRETIEAYKANHAGATYNNTKATPFLLSRLNAGHPKYYITNMHPDLQARLAQFIQSAPPGIREGITIVSGARSTQDQGRVRVQHGLQFYGRGTATVGGNPRPGELGYGSKHLEGRAVDLGWKGGTWSNMPVAAQQWLVANAKAFGLRQLPGDPTHFDMVEARGGTYNGPIKGSVYGAGVTGADGYGTAPASVRPNIERAASGAVTPTTLTGVWMVESGGTLHPGTSTAGAKGPFQFTDDTWKDYGQGGDVNNFDDAAAAANRYLNALYNKYGDMKLALYAYNWGPGNVDLYLANPSVNPLPDKVAKYANDVIAKGNGSGAVADSPGNTSPGFTGADVARQKAIDGLLTDQLERIRANSADYFSTDGGITMTPLSQVSTVQDFIDRGQQIAQGSELFNVTPADIKVFKPGEAAVFSTLLNSTDQTGKAQLMAKIAAMGKTMGGYANKQLGQDNPVFGFAGDRYLKGQHDTAMNILNGDGILTGQGGKDIVKGWGAGTPGSGLDRAEEVFNATLGPSLGAFGPGVRDTTLKAVNALYAQATRFMPPGTPLDEELYKAKIAEATGMVPVTINGEITLLKPTIPPENVNTLIEEGHVDDWAEMGREPNQPPVDAKGNVIPAETLAAEAHIFPADDEGGYYVTLLDHQPVAINVSDPRDPTRRLPYVLQLDPEHLAAKADELRQEPVIARANAAAAAAAHAEEAKKNFVPARNMFGGGEPAKPNIGAVGPTPPPTALPEPVEQMVPVEAVTMPAGPPGSAVMPPTPPPPETSTVVTPAIEPAMGPAQPGPFPPRPGLVPYMRPQARDYPKVVDPFNPPSVTAKADAKKAYLDVYRRTLISAGFEGKELEDALKEQEAKYDKAVK